MRASCLAGTCVMLLVPYAMIQYSHLLSAGTRILDVSGPLSSEHVATGPTPFVDTLGHSRTIANITTTLQVPVLSRGPWRHDVNRLKVFQARNDHNYFLTNTTAGKVHVSMRNKGELVQSDGPTGKEYVRWIWNAFSPSWHWMDISEIKRCLKDMPLLAIGDSHTRMMFHDVGIMLGYNSTYRLPRFTDLKWHLSVPLQPDESNRFEHQGPFLGTNFSDAPCVYYDQRTIFLDDVEAAKFSFLPGSCCLWLRGREWLHNLSSTLARGRGPLVIYYGSASFWDIVYWYKNRRQKKCNGTHQPFNDRLSHALHVLRDYMQQLHDQPALLFKSSWGDFGKYHPVPQRLKMHRTENNMISSILPKAEPFNPRPIFVAFQTKGLELFGDEFGHPVPEVQRSLTMMFFNSICFRSKY